MSMQLQSRTLSQSIANWAVGPAVGRAPPPARKLAARALLDTLAVTLLGSRLAGPRILASVELGRGGSPAASILGMGRKTDVQTAALVNGCSAHADLFDDNSGPMIAHPSAPLYSALLPLTQARSKSGAELVDAYIAGNEVGVALGRALNPGLYERGWHVTEVLGVVGSTVACCRLLALDEQRTAHAIGIAVSMAAGVRQNFGTMTMALHVGRAARDAVHATLLAEAGFEADPLSLEGKYGLARTFAASDLELPALGSPFELMRSGLIFKKYPSGAPTLAAIDAALALRDRLRGDPSRITEVRCLVHRWNAMTLREEEPRDMLQAKVNLRFCVACAFVFGEVTWRQFTQATLDDGRIRSFMTRISIHIGEDLPDSDEFPAEVRIATSDGLSDAERRDVPSGGSSRPLTDEELRMKFADCARAVFGEEPVDDAMERALGIDGLADVRDLCERLEGGADRVPVGWRA
jgi:2-methylcitrate dehydratase PrpD